VEDLAVRWLIRRAVFRYDGEASLFLRGFEAGDREIVQKGSISRSFRDT